MNILLIGSGGREHALAWKIRQSSRCSNLYIAPGNAGTALVGENVTIAADNFPALGRFCLDKKIILVVVGPEAPLVQGIRDYFESAAALAHILLVGPGKAGALLEGSKDFSKQFMVRHGVPTAKARTFQAHESAAALAYLEACKPPIVLKADGLAAGKGVIISPTIEEAKQAIHEMLVEKKFGEASAKVLIEEFLDGIELSVFVLTDGEDYVILPEAKDYKRIGDDDTGPNTGGMGAVSPVAFAGSAFMQKVEAQVIVPTINGLKKDGIPYKGFIFIGLMNVNDEPFVIEYNARMGDPETEAVMTRIDSDLVELLEACAKGELKNKSISINPHYAVTVIMASGGYPDKFEKEYCFGLDSATPARVFHAGTAAKDNHVVNAGGRVLAITGNASTLEKAAHQAYETVSRISWKDVYYRKDIGQDLARIEKALNRNP
ncbi:MAG: phosphoribosylamine--glycine ligase [Cyclobacteriaceae bacterium]|nr:phosphoribosylamine--glycine ligase [Cyclobacteriaceae bacterium]